MESEKPALGHVQRLLYQIQQHYNIKPGQTLCYPRDIAPILVPVNADEEFNFCERNEKWFRWRERQFSTKTTSSGTMNQLTMPPSNSFDIEDLKNQFRKEFATAKSEYWEPCPAQAVSAAFGSVVHALSDVAKLEHGLYSLTKSKREKENIQKSIFNRLTRSPRAFVTMFPNMLAVMDEMIPIPPTLSNFIRIALRPNTPSFPFLELDINLDNRSKSTELTSARLIYRTDVQDLLLPIHPVDVRFTSRTTFFSNTQRFDPALLSFLSNSNLDVWGNDMLTTPPNLALEVPLASNNEQCSSTAVVDYSFLNLSVCSDLKGVCQGFPLTLSTTKAGKSGGRKQMLHLDLLSSTDEKLASTGSHPEDKGSLHRWDTDFLLWYGTIKNIVARIPF